MITKRERKILLKEKEYLEKEIKTSPFIDPEKMQRIFQITSLLLSNGEKEDLKFEIKEKLKKSKRVTPFSKKRI